MNVFVSYAHEDGRWKDRLAKQLRVCLEPWDDTQLRLGEDWHGKIAEAMEGCAAAILLISVDFLGSEYIRTVEVPAILNRRGSCRVIPVLVGPCLWKRVAWLAPIHGDMHEGVSLSEMADAEPALARLAEEVARLFDGATRTHGREVLPPDLLDLEHLPQGAGDAFVGREDELDTMDVAWDHGGVLAIVAPGGIGKTALVDHWLARMRDDHWRGARAVYAWSFYSQGTRDDRQASEDGFLARAMEEFGIDIAINAPAADKGRALAKVLQARRTLLVLDGLEPLQYPPGPMEGQLRVPGLKALLAQLRRGGHAGLVLISSRARVPELRSVALAALGDADGARLLHVLGVRHAGGKAIADNDAELRKASKDLHGHALSVALLGRWLAKAFHGDIRRRDEVRLGTAALQVGGDHAFKVFRAYDWWLESGGRHAERATLRLLGLFDRPASAGCLAALRAEPVLPGLTEALVGISVPMWNATCSSLAELRLVEIGGGGALDAHPLLREFYAADAELLQAGHLRLYEHLTKTTEDQPDTLEGLEPLYQAVGHGVRAGRVQEACDEVYYRRISRVNEFYASNQLGAYGTELGALASFFVEPWSKPDGRLADAYQAWVLAQAGAWLRAVGRLADARQPMVEALRRAEAGGDWMNATIYSNNLSELELAMGHVAAAGVTGGRSVALADRSGDETERSDQRTTLADALTAAGRIEDALAGLAEAEAMDAKANPDQPLLWSLQGFRYCDALLARIESAAWSGTPAKGIGVVRERASQTLRWATRARAGLVTIALDHLTVARCALYSHIVDHAPLTAAPADDALAWLRRAAAEEFLPRGLLTRAWTRHVLGDPTTAREDLDESEDICERAGLRLLLADTHLHRARLFHDRTALEKAGTIIRACGYGRRYGELEDAEQAARMW